MFYLRGVEINSKQMSLAYGVQEKDQGQRNRLGRCSIGVVDEGIGVDANALGGCSERGEVKEGLIPGRHQYLKGQLKNAQQRRMCFLP